MASGRPCGFPGDIPIVEQTFRNWSREIDVPRVWVCTPSSAQDVVAVCNWAAAARYRVRPSGMRHGWSPLTVVHRMPPEARVVLVDTTQHLNAIRMAPPLNGAGPRVRVGTGATMEQLLSFLEQQTGSGGVAPGYSFPHVPATGNLTVGGVLAVNAHGTGIPSFGEVVSASYGSLSNQILELTAVVTDPASSAPGVYHLRTFHRGEGSDRALLTHLGRAFVVEVVLQVVPNYNLRCQSRTDIPASVLFQDAGPGQAPADSMAWFLGQYGRAEAIWYPFSRNPWLKVWRCCPSRPDGSRVARAPYNYPFATDVPSRVTGVLKAITSCAGGLTPLLGKLMEWFTSTGLDLGNARDLWGHSKNTLLYIKESTLRATANGYAIQTKKANMQHAIAQFAGRFSRMLNAYAAEGKYPVNSAFEIRATGLDDPRQVAAGRGTCAASPVVSSLSYDNLAERNGWNVALWFDVLTLPGTPYANPFYQELEDWIFQNYTGDQARVFPEWSKGWAYTSQGAWQNDRVLDLIRQAYTIGRTNDNDWQYEASVLKNLDLHGIFSNPFLDKLFPPGPSI